jgi:hypothetical protein
MKSLTNPWGLTILLHTGVSYSDSILFEKASKGFSEEARKVSVEFMKWSSHVHVLL